MKTLVSCDRIPKLAYYAYEDSLTPYRLNLYCDRSYVYAKETIPVEVWLLNDTQEDRSGKVVASISVDGKVCNSYSMEVSVDAAYSVCSGKIHVVIPNVDKKSTVSVDAVLYDEEGKAVYAEKYKFTAYPNKEAKDIKVASIGARAQKIAVLYGYEQSDVKDADTVIVSTIEENKETVENLLSEGRNVVVITPDVEQVSFDIDDLHIETKKGPKVYFAAVADRLKDYSINRLYSAVSDYREFAARKYILGAEGSELIYTYGKSGVDGAKAPKVHFPLVKKYNHGKGSLYVISLVLDGKLGFNPNLDEFIMDCIEQNI